MSAFFYGLALQWRLDIRSKSLLITCYVVPLLFFAIMGGIFTSINPEAKATLIQSMTVMGVTMGALIGLPPSLAEVYGSDIKKMYRANGVPLYLGLVSMAISAFLHLSMMSVIICVAAPFAFEHPPPPPPPPHTPASLPQYACSLAVLIAVSLSIGSVLGLAVRNQAKLTMISQLFFLPSIMLSGILFPIDLLPRFFEMLGKLFPAAWGYALMVGEGFSFATLWPLAALFAAAGVILMALLKRLQAEG